MGLPLLQLKSVSHHSLYIVGVLIMSRFTKGCTGLHDKDSFCVGNVHTLLIKVEYEECSVHCNYTYLQKSQGLTRKNIHYGNKVKKSFIISYFTFLFM